MKGRGYRGKVTLRSPSGERIIVEVPARVRTSEGVSVTSHVWYTHIPHVKRQSRRFRRLLSAGWKVVAQNGQPVAAEEVEAGEEQKKDTSIVDGSKQAGDASHGGKHASGEVEDSPNAAKRGKRPRGRRGGKKKRKLRRGKGYSTSMTRQARGGRSGGGAVYAPEPLQVSARVLSSAEESAELLAELVGRSHLKVQRGVTVNIEKLLVALETGDDPLPALEDPDERPKLKILVTPDCSGSTQGWNGLAQAWALHLAELPDVDVIYMTNFNGRLFGNLEIPDADTRALVEKVDVVLYLGDGDGYKMCQRYASYGAMVLGLDSYSASVANPRLKEKANTKQGGALYWVDRVSAKVPETWAEGVKLCLKP